jgi:hypothetical protein
MTYGYQMVCKGICIRHKVAGRYVTGNKRHQIYDLFIKWMHCSVLAVDID